MTEIHPSIPALLEFFTDESLPVGPQKDLATSYADFASDLVSDLGLTKGPGPGAQLNRALQKLLESRDAAIRAAQGLF
jgi:hypothetical protein